MNLYKDNISVSLYFNMKPLFICILLFACIFNINAQDNYFTHPFADSSYFQDNSIDPENNSITNNNRIHPVLSMGTAYSRFVSNLSGFSTFTRPGILFDATPKLSISTGIMFTNCNFSTTNEVDLSKSATQNLSMAYFYASGIYNVNDRLEVSGTVVKDLNSDFSNSNFNNNYNLRSGSVGFMYKLGDNIYLGAEFGFDNDRTPFYNSYNSPFNSFYNMPFGW